ncbi:MULTISPECIES: alpha/beta hydrolase [Pseudomonas]|uniref:alpha/beta hydrolase n=1 Tax=Pseudomonas nitroreducens TaxID=46680 RepID=UPI001E604F50|nr:MULTISPECIES: alpha/beta fold hydrolase [Pseudomonas]MCE4071497.1 alpha/beta hydrolase [Pseudomonas nitritireducens]MCE4081273.1 alpha/beta hydrolase [Pseudomonas nitroreducens]
MSSYQLHCNRHKGDHAKAPLLLVHGICHNSQCWDTNYVPFFTVRGHDVYALNLRGHGTDRRQLDQFGLDDYVDDVIAALGQLDGKAILVGHSMGGALVQKAMSQASSKIAAVVLLASMVPGSMTALEKLLLLRKPKSVLALRRLLAGTSLSPKQINRLPFFMGRLSEQHTQGAVRWLQPESKKALRELGSFATQGGTQPFPLLVLGSRQDYLFGASSLRRTAAHYRTQAVVLEQGCHDLMLDPDWLSSATYIANWLDEHLPCIPPQRYQIISSE